MTIRILVAALFALLAVAFTAHVAGVLPATAYRGVIPWGLLLIGVMSATVALLCAWSTINERRSGRDRRSVVRATLEGHTRRERRSSN